jgi:exonuclease III
MRFGTWNVRNHYRSDSVTAARELAKYKLDLLGVQEVSWDKGGTARARDYNFFNVNKRKSSIGNMIFCTPQNTISS